MREKIQMIWDSSLSQYIDDEYQYLEYINNR